MKGVIYTRVSSDEQIKGTSLDFQEEICRNYCRDRNIEVVEVFREEGASAKTADRKEFLRAIELCRKNKGGGIEAFVVAKVDRFARNTEDHFYVRKTLIDYGVTLHSVTEPIGNNPTEKFIETVLAGSAEFDNAVRRQRCVDGMIARINQGIFPWKPPIGYACGNTKKRGEKKNEADKPDENIFPLIQRGLREYALGQVSQADLVRLFDAWGLATYRSKKATPQFVNELFMKHLKFYAGIIVNPWVKEEVKGMHEPMITDEEYRHIKMRLSGKDIKITHQRTNPDFRLRKTILCGDCGKSLTGSFSKGRNGKHGYYHCFNHDCALYGKSLSKSVVEKAFVEKLKELTPNSKFIIMFKSTILSLWKERGGHFEAEAQRHEKQILLLEEKRARIFEMREDGSYTKEEFQERKSEIESELMTLKISRNEARIDQFDMEGSVAYAEQFMSDLARQWQDSPIHLSHRFQKLIFPDGIRYTKNEGFGTARLGLIFEINETIGAQKSALVDPAGFEPATSALQMRRSTN